MNPFFSVIIPLYNKEKYILKTLTTVLAQSFQDFEIIIIDDGSIDKSVTLIDTIKDNRILLIKQQNQGVSIARNNAISISKGSYIALLDADDLWSTNHLEELKKSIVMYPKSGLYCNNYEIKKIGGIIFPALIHIKHNNKPLVIEDYFLSSLINSVAWSSSVSFTKTYFEKVGKFNSKLLTGQDIDLWIRFALKYNIIFNPIITMTYNNFDESSLSKSKLNIIRHQIIKNYTEEEKSNSSLKKYLDINRYALSIRCKLNSEKLLYKALKKEIDFTNLNYKQKTLLILPKKVLLFLKKIQVFLVKKNIYLTAFK